MRVVSAPWNNKTDTLRKRNLSAWRTLHLLRNRSVSMSLVSAPRNITVPDPGADHLSAPRTPPLNNQHAATGS